MFTSNIMLADTFISVSSQPCLELNSVDMFEEVARLYRARGSFVEISEANFPSHKNPSYIIEPPICRFLSVAFQYTTDPPSISHGGKDCWHATYTHIKCVHREFPFLSMVIPWDPIHICICHKVRRHPARLSRTRHGLSPAKLANSLIGNEYGK